MIVKRGTQYYVLTSDGAKQLGGPYSDRAQAEKRLKEIEYFKSQESDK